MKKYPSNNNTLFQRTFVWCAVDSNHVSWICLVWWNRTTDTFCSNAASASLITYTSTPNLIYSLLCIQSSAYTISASSPFVQDEFPPMLALLGGHPESGWQDSNLRPHGPKQRILPTELHPDNYFSKNISTLSKTVPNFFVEAEGLEPPMHHGSCLTRNEVCAAVNLHSL